MSVKVSVKMSVKVSVRVGDQGGGQNVTQGVTQDVTQGNTEKIEIAMRLCPPGAERTKSRGECQVDINALPY